MNPSTIQVNNVALRTFEQEGVHQHAAGVSGYYQLISNDLVAANIGKSFRVPNSLELLSVWASAPNQINLEMDSISLLISDINNNYHNSFEVSAASAAISGYWIGWNLPFLILEKDIVFNFSATFDINRLRIFAKPCHIAETILS
jgi:hypothetical protein